MATNEIQMDTRNFDKFARELAKTSGKDYDDIMRQLAGKVLDAAVKFTPKAKASAVKKRAEIQAAKASRRMESSDGRVRVTINTGTRGGKKDRVWVGFKPEAEREWYATDIHRKMPDEAWQKSQQLLQQAKRDQKRLLAALKRQGRQSRGLAARSWVQVGRDLGVSVKAPGFVLNAKPGNGRTYKNGKAMATTAGKAYVITLINDHPTLVRGKKAVNGKAILSRAIKTRQKAQQIELEKGVLNDLKARAQRYPGIFTQ